MNHCEKRFAVFLFLLIPAFSFSQDKKSVDELLAQLEKSKQDTSRSNLLNETALEYQGKSDNANARIYAEENLNLSRKLSYE